MSDQPRRSLPRESRQQSLPSLGPADQPAAYTATKSIKAGLSCRPLPVLFLFLSSFSCHSGYDQYVVSVLPTLNRADPESLLLGRF